MTTTASELIMVDRSDSVQKAITGYAGRVASLVALRSIQTSPHMVAALDDFLGALFALLFAHQGGFVDRTNRTIEVAAVGRRAVQLRDAAIKPDGSWMAGFHFNSAIYRIAAAYHRVLKVVTGDPETGDRVEVLRPVAEKLYLDWKKSAWSRSELDRVLAQVNKLKHRDGVFRRRTVKYGQAMKSVEELLALIEAWSVQKKK